MDVASSGIGASAQMQGAVETLQFAFRGMRQIM
jgi:hypothetical protein